MEPEYLLRIPWMSFSICSLAIVPDRDQVLNACRSCYAELYHLLFCQILAAQMSREQFIVSILLAIVLLSIRCPVFARWHRQTFLYSTLFKRGAQSVGQWPRCSLPMSKKEPAKYLVQFHSFVSIHLGGTSSRYSSRIDPVMECVWMRGEEM